MSWFLTETANNGLRFTVITISVETTKVRFERRLPLPEADGVDGLQFLLCEVVFFFLGDRLFAGVDGGDGGDSATSFVVLDDLNLLSISHALMKSGLPGFHDLGSKVVTEAGHEELVPKELLHVLDPFGLHGCEVGGTTAATAAGTVLRVLMFPGLALHILSKVSQTLR